MSKIINYLIDNLIEKIKTDTPEGQDIINKLKLGIFKPIVDKCKPYIIILMYMYGVIVFLLVINLIISLLK